MAMWTENRAPSVEEAAAHFKSLILTIEQRSKRTPVIAILAQGFAMEMQAAGLAIHQRQLQRMVNQVLMELNDERKKPTETV